MALEVAKKERCEEMGLSTAGLWPEFISPSPLSCTPVAGPCSFGFFQTKVALHKGHTHSQASFLGMGVTQGRTGTYINEGGVDVVRVRNPFNRSQVNPGMIIWRKMTILH